MVAKVLIYRTEAAGIAPTMLMPGELAIEMATPTRLWVGVPTWLDGSGQKLLLDLSAANDFYNKADSDARFVNVIGDTMTGNLTINTTTPALILKNSLGSWDVSANAGNGNFAIQRFDSAGNYVDDPLYVDRATGNARIAHSPAQSMDVANKQYVDSVFGGIPPTDVSGYVLKTGDTMSGSLTINADLHLYDAGTAYFGTLGHKITRVPDTGRLYIGGGQDVIEFSATNPVRMYNTLYTQGDITSAGNIAAARAVNAGEGILCTGDIHVTGGDMNIVTGAINPQPTLNYLGNRPGPGQDYPILVQAYVAYDQRYVVMNRTTFPFVIYGAGGSLELGCGFGGLQGTTGNGSSHQSETFNMWWDSNAGATQLWVNATQMGNIQMGSDYRIKKNVAALPSMWERVKALKPISYSHRNFTTAADLAYKAGLEAGFAEGKRPAARMMGPLVTTDDTERWGFIAHELQETLTESAATGVKDSENIIQSPNPWTVIASLTKALQEAMARIEQLEASIQPAKA
jgi:hypothetical protein